MNIVGQTVFSFLHFFFQLIEQSFGFSVQNLERTRVTRATRATCATRATRATTCGHYNTKWSKKSLDKLFVFLFRLLYLSSQVSMVSCNSGCDSYSAVCLHFLRKKPQLFVYIFEKNPSHFFTLRSNCFSTFLKSNAVGLHYFNDSNWCLFTFLNNDSCLFTIWS